MAEREELILNDPLEDETLTEGEAQEVVAEPAEEDVLLFGDEEETAPKGSDSDLIKHLREVAREKDRHIAELKRNQPAPAVIGPKPTLAGCDYDEEQYERQLEGWKDAKRASETAETQRQEQARKGEEEYQADNARYQAKRSALTFKDASEAAELVTGRMTEVQKAVIVMAADNPALVEYAIGTRPGILEQMAGITNPVKLAAAVAKLEGKLKVARKSAPAPENVSRGGASMGLKTDATMERLEREAEKSGDMTKLFAYKRELRSTSR